MSSVIINCFARCGQCSSCREMKALRRVAEAAAEALLDGWDTNADVYDSDLRKALEEWGSLHKRSDT